MGDVGDVDIGPHPDPDPDFCDVVFRYPALRRNTYGDHIRRLQKVHLPGVFIKGSHYENVQMARGLREHVSDDRRRSELKVSEASSEAYSDAWP